MSCLERADSCTSFELLLWLSQLSSDRELWVQDQLQLTAEQQARLQQLYVGYTAEIEAVKQRCQQAAEVLQQDRQSSTECDALGIQAKVVLSMQWSI